jgi:SNF2 family DNA or RNA helicase
VTKKQISALQLVSEGRFFPTFRKEAKSWYARWVAADGSGNVWVDKFVRSGTIIPSCEDAEHRIHETLHDAFFAALKSRTGLVVWDEAECEQFAKDIADWNSRVCSADKKAIEFFFKTEGSRFFITCPIPKSKEQYRALGEATFVYGSLRSLRKTKNILQLELDSSQAELFITAFSRDLVAAGFSVAGVDIESHLSFSGEIDSPEEKTEEKSATFRLVIKVDGEEVTPEEVRFLLDQNSSLVFFRNRYIRINRALLKNAYRAFEKNSLGKLSNPHALRVAFGLGAVHGIELENLKLKGWIRGLVNNLKSQDASPFSIGKIKGFKGDLREYQIRGVSWMRFLADNGFGALLADDMGLGKTIQAIGFMLSYGKGPYLVVAPLTLLSNWRHEIERFAPSLKVTEHHGENRIVDVGFFMNYGVNDVVLTSYSLLVKDFYAFSSIKWGGVILDEAQAVKNPRTLVSQAVRSLKASSRIALTGTPIENSVADIWAIEEFLNKTFLGPLKEFVEKYSSGFSINAAHGSGKLRNLLEPFVLRRLKSDKAIAAELGDKHIVREYCVLSFEEKREYENTLEDYRASMRRRGDAFSLISNLKHICDGQSKMNRLLDLVSEIVSSGESALIFTQYVKIGEEMVSRLKEFLKKKIYFLHGSMTAKERESAVKSFTSSKEPEVFVLSLKAGGYGLNLTKATHVIHFDRWWNPAVENQATDRAHRIGQSKTVFVHVMITSGTIEERVDELLSKKSYLSQDVITSGESYLMRLEAEELLKISELK